MSFVVQGKPYQVQEVREYETRRDGTQQSVSFRVVHPSQTEVAADKWAERFEAKNGNIAAVQKAAKDGTVCDLVCEVENVPGRDGKKDWQKLVVLRVL